MSGTPSLPSDLSRSGSAMAMSIIRLAAALVLVAAAIIFPFMVDNYTLHLAILSGISVIAAASLNLVMCYVCKLSLGHAAFEFIEALLVARELVGIQDTLLFAEIVAFGFLSVEDAVAEVEGAGGIR